MSDAQGVRVQDEPTVAVVIPAYNASRHIVATLESVRAQSRPVAEIVVVDDGSTDNTAAVLAENECDRLRVIRTENCGSGLARNRGLEEIRSEFVVFLDADDRMRPHMVERLTELVRARPGVVAVGGESAYSNAQGTRFAGTTRSHARFDMRKIYAGELTPWQPSGTLVRVAAARAVGGFPSLSVADESTPEDLHFFRLLASQGDFLSTPDVVVEYTLHAASKTMLRQSHLLRNAKGLGGRSMVRSHNFARDARIAYLEARTLRALSLAVLAGANRLVGRTTSVAFRRR